MTEKAKFPAELNLPEPPAAFTPSESFDLAIEQKYIDATSATDTKITEQMQTWQTYINELSTGINTLKQLRKQMNMLTKPIDRELETLKSIRQK